MFENWLTVCSKELATLNLPEYVSKFCLRVAEFGKCRKPEANICQETNKGHRSSKIVKSTYICGSGHYYSCLEWPVNCLRNKDAHIQLTRTQLFNYKREKEWKKVDDVRLLNCFKSKNSCFCSFVCGHILFSWKNMPTTRKGQFKPELTLSLRCTLNRW